MASAIISPVIVAPSNATFALTFELIIAFPVIDTFLTITASALIVMESSVAFVLNTTSFSAEPALFKTTLFTFFITPFLIVAVISASNSAVLFSVVKIDFTESLKR